MGFKDLRHNLLMLWVIVLLTLTKNCDSFNWRLPFRSKETRGDANDFFPNTATTTNGDGLVAEFSMEHIFNDQKGVEKYETAVKKMAISPSNSCWQAAYRNLFAGCSKILAHGELQSRFAWQLGDCFQKESGRDAFPYCDSSAKMSNCFKKLDSDAYNVYLEYYLETNTICYKLQANAFKGQMERFITELKRSADYAGEKLESIENQAERLQQSSSEIHQSLASTDDQTRQVAQTSKVLQDCVAAVYEQSVGVEDRVASVLKQTQAVYEQSVGIEEHVTGVLKQTQAVYEQSVGTREEQAKMKENLRDGITMIQNSYQVLGKKMSMLEHEAAEIGVKIVEIGDEMNLKMKSLQSKANDIGNITGVSLHNQRQLLDSQSVALEGLHLLTSFQSQALEESKATLEKLAELRQRQQQELLQKQEQLERAHTHLVEKSNTILEAQEAFEKRQTNMFLAIDKLFTLHNAILLESRLIKTFIVYSISIFIIYMFTSTKRTYNVRPRLYIGLCAAFMIEFVALKYVISDTERQGWIVGLVRLLFAILATLQFMYAIVTYRDYEMMNHEMLRMIFEKLKNVQTEKELGYDTDSEEEDWSLWVDSDLPEDVGELEDPDYMPREEIGESSGSTTVTRKYLLRNRCHL